MGTERRATERPASVPKDVQVFFFFFAPSVPTEKEKKDGSFRADRRTANGEPKIPRLICTFPAVIGGLIYFRTYMCGRNERRICRPTRKTDGKRWETERENRENVGACKRTFRCWLAGVWLPDKTQIDQTANAGSGLAVWLWSGWSIAGVCWRSGGQSTFCRLTRPDADQTANAGGQSAFCWLALVWLWLAYKRCLAVWSGMAGGQSAKRRLTRAEQTRRKKARHVNVWLWLVWLRRCTWQVHCANS